MNPPPAGDGLSFSDVQSDHTQSPLQELRMSRLSPPLVPGSDATVHIVLDDFGEAGRIYREAAQEDTNLHTVVREILTGQYKRPVRVVAFNLAGGWARDVTEEVAREVRKVADEEQIELQGAALQLVERT